jgi:hypothetical protein
MQQFAVNRIEWGLDGYEIRFRRKAHDVVHMPKPVEFVEYKPNTIADPLMTISEEGAQSLINELWIAGIRPSERIIEPQNRDHMNGEIKWLRETADHLMKKP